MAKMRKFITARIATTIYKQAILPLFDYAEFLKDSSSKNYTMIESSSLPQIRRLEKLQEKAVKYIDNNTYGKLKYEELCDLYGLQPVKMRWREHILCLMYRQSKMHHHVDTI